jgi:chromate transporter
MGAEGERQGMATVREEPVGGSGRLTSVSLFFLRLGATAFGGPAVYIAMMRDEVVSRRRWLTDAHFLDLLGATNLIPGPNAAEMAMHIGRLRAGWRGLVLAGLCFTAPATGITLAFAWSYVRFGSTPELSWVLYGVKPIVIGVMIHAIFSLSRPMMSRPLLFLLGGSALALYFLGVNEIALLFGAGLAVVLVAGVGHLRAGWSIPALVLPGMQWLAGAGAAGGASSFSLGVLFLTLLKIGCILYGGGYVLVTFLRADFVDRLGWLTEQQLLDAVAAGQVTPGPLLSTVTFIGYILGSWPGALLATVGVFLPSFAVVAVAGPLIPSLRRLPWTAALLDGVSVAALALMAGVTWQLGRAAIVDVPTAVLTVVGAILLLKLRVNPTWLVLLGAASGFLIKVVG